MIYTILNHNEKILIRSYANIIKFISTEYLLFKFAPQICTTGVLKITLLFVCVFQQYMLLYTYVSNSIFYLPSKVSYGYFAVSIS